MKTVADVSVVDPFSKTMAFEKDIEAMKQEIQEQLDKRKALRQMELFVWTIHFVKVPLGS